MGDDGGLLDVQSVEQTGQQIRLGGDRGVAVHWTLRAPVTQQVVGDRSVAGGLDVRHDVPPLVRVGRGAVNEHHRLALAAVAVGETGPVNDQVTGQEVHAVGS